MVGVFALEISCCSRMVCVFGLEISCCSKMVCVFGLEISCCSRIVCIFGLEISCCSRRVCVFGLEISCCSRMVCVFGLEISCCSRMVCVYLVWKSAVAAEWSAPRGVRGHGEQHPRQHEPEVGHQQPQHHHHQRHQTTGTTANVSAQLCEHSCISFMYTFYSSFIQKRKKNKYCPTQAVLILLFLSFFFLLQYYPMIWSANSVEASPSEFLNKFTLIFCESASSRPHLLTCKTVLH